MDTVRHSIITTLFVTVAFAFNGCDATYSNPLNVSFRLTDQATATPLTNVVVSVYDGFDRSLPPFGGPVKKDNTPYHFADITTSTNGTFDLDLSQLKEDTILIEAVQSSKHIRHRGSTVTVVHYNREGNSLRATANYSYDLKTKLVTVTRFPEERSEQAREFSIIEVPIP